MKKKQLKLYLYGLLIFICFGCSASYNLKSRPFQRALQSGDVESAFTKLDGIKFLQRKRNKLLYFFEKGKAAFLTKKYRLSNDYFNKADAFISENKRALGGKLLGLVLNPEHETYIGEDFEKVAIHYYKALNYLFLNEFDDALVEAKRINLRLQQINDKYPKGKKNRYTTDAFALNLQGMLYEASGDINNAFIAYRNAIELYIEHEGNYFGTSTPKQLIKDVLRTASFLGFKTDVDRYESLFNTSAEINHQNNGALIVFWENGLVPFKEENFLAFTNVSNGKTKGFVNFFNKDLGLNISVPVSNSNSGNFDISVFNIAFPKHIPRTPVYNQATITKDSSNLYVFEMAENLEVIAVQTLRDRALRDVAKTALRLGIKKVSEYVLKNQNNDLGNILGVFNALTEGADTRNWQSLPKAIHYSRIPLEKGENTFTIEIKGANETTTTKQIKINGNGNIIFDCISTLQSL